MKIDAETMKKQVILHLPYVLFLLVFAKLGEAVRLAPGADASQKLLGLSEGFALAFQSMWPGAAMDWLIGLCGAAIMRLAVYLRGKDAKKYRKNVEYGSARWGNKADIVPFMDPKPETIFMTEPITRLAACLPIMKTGQIFQTAIRSFMVIICGMVPCLRC